MTKKYLNLSFIYAIIGLVAGAFYREFTKYIGYTARTRMALAHPHFLVLGAFMFLIIALFSMNLKLENEKTFKTFFLSYNIGVVITAAMLFLRGLTEVMDWGGKKALDASISGIAGVGHIVLTVGFVFMFITLKRAIDNRARN